jgi:hypothetical protein
MKPLGKTIPRSVDSVVRKEIQSLSSDWEIRASRAHYFLYVDDRLIACIGSRGARKPDTRLPKLALTTMKRNLSCT